MKKHITCFMLLLFLVLIALIGCVTPSIHNIRKIEDSDKISTETLKLMTFNIRAGCGKRSPKTSPLDCVSSKKYLNNVTLAIESEDPDVIALQEVRGYSQAKYIAEKLNLNYSYIAHNNRMERWGLAVLSKHRIQELGSAIIHHGRNQRSAQKCIIEIDNTPVNIVNVHYNLGNYKTQIKTTMNILEDIKGPIVLLGDLNRLYNSPEMIPIKDKLIDTCLAVDTENSKIAMHNGTFGYGGTFYIMGKRYSAGGSVGRIDYIFLNRDFFKIHDAGLVSRKHWAASDHIAYWAKVRLKK